MQQTQRKVESEMENASFEQALEVVKTLPAMDKRRLQQWLSEDEQTQLNANDNGGMKPAYFRESEMHWLSQHEAEYAGQWLALDGDRLVSYGADPHQVSAEAKAAGVPNPFVVYAENSNEPYWGGWS
jgi:hypothetical protein